MTTSIDVDEIDVSAAVSDLGTNGFAVIGGVLDRSEVDAVVERLWAAAAESERRGIPTRIEGLDPNAANVRVFNLIDLDPVFGELIAHPVAEAVATALLGPDHIVSNFTANIARPGSESMVVHSDQSIVAPEPWLEPWSLNIIWCLCDVRRENGATRYAPGSQRYTTSADLPGDLAERMVPFEAPAGSIVAMEGRVWHTSGANVTDDEDRPLLFGYYTKPFVRPQWNFPVGLRPEVQQGFSPTMRYRLGLDLALNSRAPAPT
ncbi:MAG: phytanoyl-CoA dioxygenase family protein [Actinomycetota bacterium]|nr:phytanoyl-CoA dioxygenase family protein [Actinomycetota bacterium]